MTQRLKKFPYHVRSRLQDQSSIALIITLAVMSLLLVLVLTFATVSQVEVQTATANRDIVQSKLLAQAALNRAMADLIQQYQQDSNTMNDGLEGTRSVLTNKNGSFTTVTMADISGYSTNFFTDIEKDDAVDPRTGRTIATPGADGKLDYVVIPADNTNYAPSYIPQWIGIKNTNGDLVGRIAYMATGAGLCINAIGNTMRQTNGTMVMNSRNQGLYPTEINLPAALYAMGWTWAQATNDATLMLKYRYGPDGFPGTAGDDSATTNTVVRSNGLDENGNGVADENTEDMNDPEEVLAASDETTNPVITAVGDDAVFTDLKQLYDNSVIPDAAADTRFSSNFRSVQRYFCTQSPVRISSSLINLNDTNYVADTNAFFTALTNRFAIMKYPTSNTWEQAQIAANIVTYRTTNIVNGHRAPLVAIVNGTNYVGVGPVPHWNEITYRIVLDMDRTTITGTNWIALTLTNIQVIGEVWYPYTNSAFPAGGAQDMQVMLRRSVTAVSPAFVVLPGTGFQPFARDDTPFVKTAFSMPACTVATCTNSSQFATFTNILSVPGYWSNMITLLPDVVVSNVEVAAELRNNTAPNQLYDNVQGYPYFSPVATNYVFPKAAISNAIVGGPNHQTLTGFISLAFNDPRCHTNYQFFTNATWMTIGARNTTNALTFNPTSTNADDGAVTAPIAGIATNTFYFPNHAYFATPIQLGRVHRSSPWQTIDFTAGRTYSAQDNQLLNNFTVYKPGAGGATNFVHGRVNLNTAKSELPVWAALFAGMPIWDDSTFVDFAGGNISSLTKTSNLVTVAAGLQVQYPSDIPNVNFTKMSTLFPTAGWPAQKSDRDKEWIIDHMFNLVSPLGAGNFFSVWAWGQALKGNTNDFSRKRVAAETLIMAMVKPDFFTVGSTWFCNMKIVYFRYNPDLDFTVDTESYAQSNN